MTFQPGKSPAQYPYRLVASAAQSGAVLAQLATEKQCRAEQRKHAGSILENYRAGAWFTVEGA